YELLLLDTTSSYFESDLDDHERATIAGEWSDFDLGRGPEPEAPRPQVVNRPALRKRGNSKDKRPNEPQVVIAALCTATGQIVKWRSFPGNTQDQNVMLKMVSESTQSPEGGRKVVVSDCGLAGAPNIEQLDALEQPPDRITAVPLRKSKFGRMEVLSGVGRYRQHPTKRHIRYRVVRFSAEDSPSQRAEVWIATRNRKEQDRQLRQQTRHLARINKVLAKDDRAEGHGEEVTKLLANRTLKRYITKSADGQRLTIDPERVREEKLLAGVHLLRSTLVDWNPLDILAAYQALLNVEDNFRMLKGPIKLRPMHHRAARRIRAHISVCMLSLIVLRRLEQLSGLRYRQLAALFNVVKATRVEQGDIQFWQRNEWSGLDLHAIQNVQGRLGPLIALPELDITL
ncbi:MAG: IS1634 family transposase, partial [Chloroflexia bacterium]|nr:IS1634 family transposase [Chloroflexia bacterium]